ncbi:MAG TPA: hypothetical protein VHH35_18700, partial [Pyrinomonadaceae bacterium]|nr:hypothetical protein [Pyrinomonadaceae bacterium]
MSYTQFRKPETMAMLFVLLIACIATVSAEYGPDAKAQAPAKQGSPTLTATLVDPEKKAQQKAATVSVKVDGITLVDPATVMEKPMPGQGHL